MGKTETAVKCRSLPGCECALCKYVFVITMQDQDEGDGLYVEGVYSTVELARERVEVLKDKNPSYYVCSQRFEVERKLP